MPIRLTGTEPELSIDTALFCSSVVSNMPRASPIFRTRYDPIGYSLDGEFPA